MQVKAATLKFYAGDLRAIAHVGDAIAAIGSPKCVASSGTPEKIHHGLTCAGRYELFAPNIFSATQVARGKPAPDLYRYAADRLGVAIADCAIIEDSPVGATGAVASGGYVIGLVAGSHCGAGHADRLRAIGVDAVARDFGEVAALLGQI